MTLQGKGFFINDIAECEDGEPAAIVQLAQAGGLSFVVLKIAEGTQPAGLDAQGKDLLPAVVQALERADIAAWGWQYIRGKDPEAEAKAASERLLALGLKGYVLNAEAEYEEPGREPAARQFMATLRTGVNVPIALCSYSFPDFHPNLPWAAFLEGSELYMPKVLWELAHNPGEQLREAKRQCEALPNTRPIVPVGAAYRTTAWAPSPEDVTEFLETARGLDLPAAAFFPWDACRKDLPLNWKAIAEYPWPRFTSSVSQPLLDTSLPDPLAEQFLEGLNSRQAEQMTGLYTPTAVRTWAGETCHGAAEIQAAYTALFGKMPQGMVFRLTRSKVDQDVHVLRWTAGRLTGETTLVIRDGKIIQDYTYLTP